MLLVHPSDPSSWLSSPVYLHSLPPSVPLLRVYLFILAYWFGVLPKVFQTLESTIPGISHLSLRNLPAKTRRKKANNRRVNRYARNTYHFTNEMFNRSFP